MFRANVASLPDAGNLSQVQANRSASAQPGAGFEQSLYNSQGDGLPYARYGFSALSDTALPSPAAELPRIVVESPQSSFILGDTAHTAPDQYSVDEAAIFGALDTDTATMTGLQAPPMPKVADTTGKPQTREDAGYVPFEPVPLDRYSVDEAEIFGALEPDTATMVALQAPPMPKVADTTGKPQTAEDAGYVSFEQAKEIEPEVPVASPQEIRRNTDKAIRKAYRNVFRKHRPVMLVNDIIIPVSKTDLRHPDADPSQRNLFYMHKDPTIEVMSQGAAAKRLIRKREAKLRTEAAEQGQFKR